MWKMEKDCRNGFQIAYIFLLINSYIYCVSGFSGRISREMGATQRCRGGPDCKRGRSRSPGGTSWLANLGARPGLASLRAQLGWLRGPSLASPVVWFLWFSILVQRVSGFYSNLVPFLPGPLRFDRRPWLQIFGPFGLRLSHSVSSSKFGHGPTWHITSYHMIILKASLSTINQHWVKT